VNEFLVKETWEKQAQQIDGNVRDGPLRGKVFAVKVVDTPRVFVGGNQLFCQLSDCRLHGRSIQQEGCHGKSAPKTYGAAEREKIIQPLGCAIECSG
jgi:hypothetical protein